MSSAAPRDATAFEVREALREPGCAVCQLCLRSVARLLRSIAYEQVNDVDLRSALRRAGGFCNLHAHQWLRDASSVLGTALIYRDVLAATLRELDSSASITRGGRLRGLLARAGASAAECPACRAQADAEERYLGALLALIVTDAAVRAVLETSDGLCRRHTLAALRSGRDGAQFVADRAREAIEALLGDLDEVIRKEDYRFRHEPRSEAERTAPARAITWAAGANGLTDP